LPQATQADHTGLESVVLLDQIQFELFHAPHQRAVVRSDEAQVPVACQEARKGAGSQHHPRGVESPPLVDIPEAAIENGFCGQEPLTRQQERTGCGFIFSPHGVYLKVDLRDYGPRHADLPLDIGEFGRRISHLALEGRQVTLETASFLAHRLEPALAIDDLPLDLDRLPGQRRRRECFEPGEDREGHSQPEPCVENPHLTPRGGACGPRIRSRALRT